MIPKGAGVAALLKKPDTALRGVLLYGPDQGLVRERAAAVLVAAGGDAADPFATVELDGAVLRGDPARLSDEAAALSFSGRRRVVRVRGATDQATAAVEAWLAGPGDGFVIVEAGDLAKRSSLRVAFEKAKATAAVACYVDEGADLARLVGQHLSDAGLGVDAEAVDFLAGRFGGDRGVIRSELDKLVLYMDGSGTVGVEEAARVVGDVAAASLDAVTEAACGGDPEALETALRRAFAQGVAAVSVLRAVARHLDRLMLAGALVGGGDSVEKAMAALRPPVFFKAQPAFRRQLRLWPAARIAPALALLLEAELDCKTTGLAAEPVSARALLRLASGSRPAAEPRPAGRRRG